jgi:ATP-binding cassette subfamily B protein RaxB
MPLVFQTEAAECGLACLAMILGHHQLITDLPTLRARHRVSMTGLTLADLSSLAHQEKLGTRALRLDLDELNQLRLPAILHWDMNHFVVLKSITNKKVVILDPAVGKRQLEMKEVSKHFTGVALELWPNPGFEPRQEKTRIRISQLIGQMTGLWQALSQVLLLSLALEVFTLLTPLFMQWVLDYVVVSKDMQLMNTLLIGFALLMVLQLSTGILRSWLLMIFATNISVQWQSNVFTHLIRLPLSYFHSRHLGDIVSRSESIGEIQNTLTSALVETLFDGLLVTLTLALMFMYSPTLAIVAVIAIVIYFGIRMLWYRPFYNATEEKIVRDARLSSHFLETIRGIRAIQLFTRHHQRRSTWQNLLVESTNSSLRLQKYNILYGLMRDFLASSFTLLIVWLGVRQIGQAELTVGMLVAFMAYRGQFDDRVTALIDKLIQLRLLRLQAERLADIVLTPTSSDSEGELSPQVIFSQTEKNPPNIEIKGLDFRYGDKSPWILKNLNLFIDSGEVLAIAGRSGSGKSTLVNLLLGTCTPENGQILIDGQVLKQGELSKWRAQVATVMQDDTLFAGSISDNICFFDALPDRSRIIDCASMANLHEDIEKMPMTYQTLVGDMGTTLSGGQKQRLLLARALYKQPSVLILDEATSQLDIESEAKVNSAVKRLSMTRIIVAHRPETIASAHRVIEIDLGQITFDGTPSAYFKYKGYFLKVTE